MPNCTITTPAYDGDPFPDTVAGSYSTRLPVEVRAPHLTEAMGGAPGDGADVQVTITQSDDSTQKFGPTAASTAADGRGTNAGSWTLTKPSGLIAGKTYTVVAVLTVGTSTYSDAKNDVQN